MASSVPVKNNSLLLFTLAAIFAVASLSVFWWSTLNEERSGGTEEEVAQEQADVHLIPGSERRLAIGSKVGSVAPDRTSDRSPGMADQTEIREAKEDRQLLSRLRRQGVVGGDNPKLVRRDVTLYPELMTHLADSSNWMPELMKASSSILPRADGEPTLLSIDSVAADSVLWEFGMREGDVIALIDGEIPHFSPTKALDYIRKADGVMTALDKGEPVSLTVLRQGQLIHLVFRRW